MALHHRVRPVGAEDDHRPKSVLLDVIHDIHPSYRVSRGYPVCEWG